MTSTLQRVLITVSGPDTAGITCILTGIIADGGGTLMDIEQVVLSGQLTLCLVVAVPRGKSGPGSAVLKDLLFAAKELGLELDFKVLDEATTTTTTLPKKQYSITVLGDVVDAGVVHAVTSCLAKHHANIDEIQRLSEGDLSSLQIVISVGIDEAGESALQAALVQVARDKDVDLAFQVEDLARRTKRLVVFDMDSTLIRIEIIDELARAHGVYDDVAAITANAMAGGIPFEESLRLRVSKLAGLPASTLQRLAAELPLTDGANDLLMLEKAGLGIAFHAKAKLRDAADTSVSRGGLDRVLYLLGLHARDVRKFLGSH